MKASFRYKAGAWLAGVAIALGLYKALSPVSNFDPAHTYAPNDIQQEFLKLAARHHDYVALGDSDHSRAEIALFALNPKTASSLSAGGAEHYFLELKPQHDPSLQPVPYDYAGIKKHVCDRNARAALNRTFNQTLTQGAVQFHAVDMREDSPSYKAMNRFNPAVAMAVGPALYYRVLHDCQPREAFVLVKSLSSASRQRELLAGLLDDTPTVQRIQSLSNGRRSAIFYGAGHFVDIIGHKMTMRDQLPVQGRTMAVIGIFKDKAQRQQVLSDLDRLRHERTRAVDADAVFYVMPGADHADGIEPVSETGRALYRQAKQNLAARPR